MVERFKKMCMVDKILSSGLIVVFLRYRECRKFSFWKGGWLNGDSVANKFGRLFLVSDQQDKMIGDIGRWVDGAWLWEFRWRRQLFKWESDLLMNLQDRLRVYSPKLNLIDSGQWEIDNFKEYIVHSTYDGLHGSLINSVQAGIFC